MRNIITILCLILLSKTTLSSTPIGFFDVADNHAYLSGWALDPSLPNQSLIIHFYANAPAGASGSVFIGATTANSPRPDVNSATGYPGNHGFGWQIPVDMMTPCAIVVYAYAIDPHNVNNKHLTNSPKQVPILEGEISGLTGSSSISIKANSKYAGAIYSLTWNGVQFIDQQDHGRLLQTASSFYNSYSPPSWTAECYNPTEAGSHADGSGACSSSELLGFSAANNVLQTSTRMAYYATLSSPSSCNTGVINGSTTLSNHIMDKKVTIGVPGIQNAIKYEITHHIPSNEINLAMGQFEVLTGYMPSSGFLPRFNSWYRYNQSTQTLTNTNGNAQADEGRPIVISTADGNYAMGIYSPDVKVNSPNGYGQFDTFGTVSKWNIVRRIPNIVAGQTLNFTVYLCVGTLENVRLTLSQLILNYPNL